MLFLTRLHESIRLLGIARQAFTLPYMLGIYTSLLFILWQISLRVLVTEAAENSNTLQMVIATIGGPCHFRLYQQVGTTLMARSPTMPRGSHSGQP